MQRHGDPIDSYRGCNRLGRVFCRVTFIFVFPFFLAVAVFRAIADESHALGKEFVNIWHDMNAVDNDVSSNR